MDNPAFQDVPLSKDVPNSQNHDPENESNAGGGDQTVRMKRQIGLLGGVALIVGTMIGSGIFITPQRLLTRTDSVAMSLCVWVACGILALLSALSYCELGTVIPRSGGEHAYFMGTFSEGHKFFGQIPAFLFSWLTVLLLKPSSLAIISLAFGQYALYPLLSSSRFELCDPSFQDSDEYQMARKLLAVFVALLIAVVNIFSAKLATRVAIIFLVAKISAMSIFIVIGIYNISKGEWGALTGEWDTGEASWGDIVTSFYSGLWAYDGWNNLGYAIEELANPYRNLPLAIIIGIPLVMALYLFINLAYLTALTKFEMINSEAVAIAVGDQYLGVMKWVVPVLVTLSVAGTGNGSMFSAGRISYVSGREGHMVDVLSYVHVTRLTPIVALLVNAGLAIPMIFASELNDLIDLFSFASWAIYGLALSCVVILRFTKPHLERPFRVPIIIPIISVLVSIILVVVPIANEPKIEYLYCLGFTIIGLFVYFICVYKKCRVPFMDNITEIIQLSTLAAPSPYKED